MSAEHELCLSSSHVVRISAARDYFASMTESIPANITN